jgi:ABC-2 type transport system permease protein
MQREGSPFTGLSTVALKEAADHMTSARMHLVMLLVILTAIGAIYGAIGQIKATIGEDPFLFLRLFTTAREPLPSFVAFLGFLLPLVGIALGFDGINGEYSRRTMSRILSQPIYRDALLAGKFLGGSWSSASVW